MAAPGLNHRHMLGAWLVWRLPGLRRPPARIEQGPQGLFLLWLVYVGLLLACAVLLYQRGVWAMLIEADPTRLTLAILLLFAASTGWVGRRAWCLGRERAALERCRADPVGWHRRSTPGPEGANAGLGSGNASGTATPSISDSGCERYLHSALAPQADTAVSRDLLSERTHGPHEMAWWFNGIQLKLGLLGKVIGFSILALELGQLDNFDPSQSAQLLRSLTGGLGIALLTTMTGLAGNILLGVQLMRLDRYADTLVADTLELAQQWRQAPPWR
jgi:hypothetical protein